MLAGRVLGRRGLPAVPVALLAQPRASARRAGRPARRAGRRAASSISISGPDPVRRRPDRPSAASPGHLDARSRAPVDRDERSAVPTRSSPPRSGPLRVVGRARTRPGHRYGPCRRPRCAVASRAASRRPTTWCAPRRPDLHGPDRRRGGTAATISRSRSAVTADHVDQIAVAGRRSAAPPARRRTSRRPRRVTDDASARRPRPVASAGSSAVDADRRVGRGRLVVASPLGMAVRHLAGIGLPRCRRAVQIERELVVVSVRAAVRTVVEYGVDATDRGSPRTQSVELGDRTLRRRCRPRRAGEPAAVPVLQTVVVRARPPRGPGPRPRPDRGSRRTAVPGQRSPATRAPAGPRRYGPSCSAGRMPPSVAIPASAADHRVEPVGDGGRVVDRAGSADTPGGRSRGSTCSPPTPSRPRRSRPRRCANCPCSPVSHSFSPSHGSPRTAAAAWLAVDTERVEPRRVVRRELVLGNHRVPGPPSSGDHVVEHRQGLAAGSARLGAGCGSRARSAHPRPRRSAPGGTAGRAASTPAPARAHPPCVEFQVEARVRRRAGSAPLTVVRRAPRIRRAHAVVREHPPGATHRLGVHPAAVRARHAAGRELTGVEPDVLELDTVRRADVLVPPAAALGRRMSGQRGHVPPSMSMVIPVR